MNQQQGTKNYKITTLSEGSLFTESSPEIRKVIIEIGCTVYQNLSSITHIKSEQDQKEFQKELDSLKDKNKETLEENKNVKRELETLSKELRDYYDGRSREEHERTKEHHNEVILQYKEMINSLKSNIESLEEVRIHQEEVIRKYEKKESMKTVERGIEGESNVLEYLSRSFTEGELRNTTKKGSHGDIHYKYRGVDILIEVKNKENITLEDISKFKRDVLETRSDGGILVSIKEGVKIPCHSIYDVEWMKEEQCSIPLLYITNYENNESMLYTGVKTIHFYVENGKEKEGESGLERKKEFDNLLDIVRSISYNMDDLSMDAKRINDRIFKLQTMIKDKVDQCVSLKTEKSYEDQIFELFTCYELTNNGELPTEDYLTSHSIAKKTIRELGGLKELKKRYNSSNT